MSKLEWITNLSDHAVQNLVSSVDTVLFDIDGVLIRNRNLIPGSDAAVAKLRELGKKIGFVTNNSFYSIDRLQNNLAQFRATRDEIENPYTGLIRYLKKTGLKDKDIFVISCSLTKKLLKQEGYNVIEYKDIQTTELEETILGMKNLSLKTLEVCKNVGIVYLDTDINCHYGEVQIAQIILSHVDGVQLLSGMCDDKAPIDEQFTFICAKYYIDGLERMTKRKAVQIAKPGQTIADMIVSKLGITERNRVLIVGDNISTDIAFGVNAGFKTCLVLSGISNMDQVDDWKDPDEFKPDYVAYSLGEIYEKIKYMS